MRVPDLEYLIDTEENKQEERDRIISEETYYYHVEMIRASIMAPNRNDLHNMEKDARKQRELKKLKRLAEL